MYRVWIAAVTTGLLCGCQAPTPRLNAPPHGTAERISEVRDNFEHMIDNAQLEDMTVSDIHFVPHRPMLNSLGRERLQRLASLLEFYGGVICFNTAVTDDELLAARTGAILAFLNDQGLITSGNTIRRDLPEGRGMDANQAILIMTHEASYAPKKEGNGGSTIELKMK